MGQSVCEDRQRSAAIYAAYQQPGATLAIVGQVFDLSPSRVARIVKREEARDRRADPLKWAVIDMAREKNRWMERE